jgi:hypothetical protein
MSPIDPAYLSIVTGAPMRMGCTVGLLHRRIRTGQRLNLGWRPRGARAGAGIVAVWLNSGSDRGRRRRDVACPGNST